MPIGRLQTHADPDFVEVKMGNDGCVGRIPRMHALFERWERPDMGMTEQATEHIHAMLQRYGEDPSRTVMEMCEKAKSMHATWWLI